MKKIYNWVELNNVASDIYWNEKNMKRAIMILNDLRKKGSFLAEEYIGLSYYLRFYKRKNIKRAVRIFKKLDKYDLCNNSLPYLGECYYCGIGVKKDYEKAKKIFDKEIQQGGNRVESYFTNPNFYLGEMYLLGYGVEKNYSNAKKYLEKCYKTSDNKELYIYPYRLYYYLGNIKRIEDNNTDNLNNNYYNFILAQILNNISCKNIEIYKLEDLYKAIDKYSYKEFIKNQRIKELRTFERHIGYLSKSEFAEMMGILKTKIEKCMRSDKFNEMFLIYYDNYIDWFFKIILESYNYEDVEDYINSLIEQKDYATLKIMEKMYSDGLIVEKDKKKAEEYEKKMKEADDKEWKNLMKGIDTGINDLEKGINEN